MKTLLPKTLLLGAAAAAMSLTAFAASAQTYRGGHNPYYSNSYSGGYSNGYARGQDHRDDGHDNRGWNGNRSYSNGYDRDRYARSYGDRQSYGYGRSDNSTGIALAAGVVGLMLGSALSSNHSSNYQQGYSYQQPYYQQSYSYPQSYGYAQPYSYGYSPY